MGFMPNEHNKNRRHTNILSNETTMSTKGLQYKIAYSLHSSTATVTTTTTVIIVGSF